MHSPFWWPGDGRQPAEAPGLREQGSKLDGEARPPLLTSRSKPEGHRFLGPGGDLREGRGKRNVSRSVPTVHRAPWGPTRKRSFVLKSDGKAQHEPV